MRDLTSSPTIAVAIAARNATRFIGATLDSLVEQSRKPDQVIVIDDGSTDGTAALASIYKSRLSNLTVIQNQTSLGISAARNRANAAAETDYIAVLDADDLFGPDTMQQYAEFLTDHPDTDLLYADTRVYDSEMNHGKARHYPSFRTSREAIRRTLGSPLVPFKHSSMVYRREAFEEIGGYDESLPIKVDVDLFLRFHAEGMKVLKLDQTTSLHRKHDRQVSVNRLRGIKAYRRLVQTYEPDPIVRGLLLSTRIPSEMLKLLLRG
ncbi:MAG: glycosyltransferase family 2 protein [Verrucomicrobiales bacterium]|nr:glycosyltransferase family 2 protein [Verrucomicrobiales bacterium]